MEGLAPTAAPALDHRRSGFGTLPRGWRRLVQRAENAHRSPIAPVLPLLALLVATTLWTWRSTVAETTRIARERFSFRLGEAELAIQQRLLAYEQVLRGGVALFATRPDVSRDEWHDYVRTLEIAKRFPGIQGIGYAAALRPDQLPAHLRKVRAEGYADYEIRPAGERAEYTPMVYLEPFDWRNARAFGYDMLTEPALRAALSSARDSGRPAASGQVRLVQETADGVQRGFVMCLPVYKPGDVLTTAPQRRAALTGYVCSTYRIDDLLQGILGPDALPDALPNIRLRIFDGAVSEGSLLYDSLEGAAAMRQGSYRSDRRFEFGGRQWSLHFESLPAFDASVDTQRANLVLTGGMLISVLLTAVVWSLLLNRRRAGELAMANGGLQAEIEERTKLEAELKRARNAAEAANQAKSDFLANVSHELRTPLTLIMAPLEQLLSAAVPPAGWRTQLDRAQRNAVRLLSRVNDILDFSKAEAGKFELHSEAVDLVEAIGLLASDAAVAAQGKQCTLTWSVDPALGRVCLDPRHFEKIALNLIGNAIKFTPAHGTIHVSATVIDAADFEFAVEDSGIGIAADKLSLLFQRFSQIDTSATRSYSGTGIGLALVKELAVLMGGTVGVVSTVGQGSRFFVRLTRGGERLDARSPADSALESASSDASRSAWRQLQLRDGNAPLFADAAVTATPAHGPGAQPVPARRGLAQVLVVDDSAEMRAYVSELLHGECDVVTADDGEQAWALLQRMPVDLVVSDVMMPRLDGFGLAARIKASATLTRIPVILLTARGGTDAAVSGLETGADDYVAKPFSPSELKARVRAALRMGQVHTELREKSRQAGMAQIATNVLHNVGNVLTSVNVSANLVSRRLRGSKVKGLARAVRLMDDHADDLGPFLTLDARGKLLPAYLRELAQTLEAEHDGMADELGALGKSIDHIKEVVAAQQAYAGAPCVVELVMVGELVDDALLMSAPRAVLRTARPPRGSSKVAEPHLLESAPKAAGAREQVSVVTDLADLPALPMDRHRVLQILVNLIGNAKHAVSGVTDRSPCITLAAALADTAPGRVLRITVADNGVGIAPEHLTRVFAHGFTTRKNGHGFGLHSCILAAQEMGGSLTARSDGVQQGAAFTLDLPVDVLEGQR